MRRAFSLVVLGLTVAGCSGSNDEPPRNSGLSERDSSYWRDT